MRRSRISLCPPKKVEESRANLNDYLLLDRLWGGLPERFLYDLETQEAIKHMCCSIPEQELDEAAKIVPGNLDIDAEILRLALLENLRNQWAQFKDAFRDFVRDQACALCGLAEAELSVVDPHPVGERRRGAGTSPARTRTKFNHDPTFSATPNTLICAVRSY